MGVFYIYIYINSWVYRVTILVPSRKGKYEYAFYMGSLNDPLE